MATAELYYTKDSQIQKRNHSEYFYERFNQLQEEKEWNSISVHQFKTLSQKQCTFTRITEHFSCFQSTINDNKRYEAKKDIFNSKKNVRKAPPQQCQNVLSSKIAKSNQKIQFKAATSSEHPFTSPTTANNDFSRKACKYNERKHSGTEDQSLPKTLFLWCEIFIGFSEGESQIPNYCSNIVFNCIYSINDFKASLVAYSKADLCKLNQQNGPSISASKRIESSGLSREAQNQKVLQSNNCFDNNDTYNNNHFQYKTFLPNHLQSSLELSNREHSVKDAEINSDNKIDAKCTPSLLQGIGTLNTGIYKQFKKDRSKEKVCVHYGSTIHVSEVWNCEKTTCPVNFIHSTKSRIKKNNAVATKTVNSTNNRTRLHGQCCQNNVSKSIVPSECDKIFLLQKRIDILMKDISNMVGRSNLHCKFKPHTYQNSKTTCDCKLFFQSNSTLPKYEEKQVCSKTDDERLQSSIFLTRSTFSSNFCSQSRSANIPTLPRLSSKTKRFCLTDQLRLSEIETLQHHSKQRSEWIPIKSKKSVTPADNKSILCNTAKSTIGENSQLCRRFSGNASKAFTDIKKLTCAIFPLFIIFNILPLLYAECDQTFVSRVGGPQNGTFSAPLVHNPKNHSRQCLYIFLAGPGQRVEVVFTTFNLRGSPPDGSAVGELPTCVHEYMDIYSEVQSSDPADLINSPFGGRFCGTIPPRRRISMHRAIAISFFTNKNVSEPDLFEGYYRFLNASEYEIGIPIAGSPCSYTITPSMSLNKTGALISPTYPGAYPKDMSCTYQFLGETNQRVRLEFRDFDLFFGGPHCPFDYIKVYDGPDNSSALIGTYCGQQRNLVLYSSESSLFVHFYTLPRTANTQNRGFKGIYEFSESFVKLDFIRENDGIHIRGSECDQKILSKKESVGFVLSPNYPYPYIPKTVCRYFIYGMQDAQNLERVRLEFSSFNIPKVENKDKGESNCSDGYLKIYLKGQETADAYDKFDYELCGNETQKVVSDGPRLAMVFSSGELQGRGFKGKYTFETEYKIPGTAAPDGTCSFTYVSSSKKRGDLNSPRYPSNYPSETNCSYLFLAEPNEQVTIVFDHFKVKADNINSTAGAYGASACFEDWLEIYVIYRDNNDRFLGRYCGLTAPGPVESPRGAVGLRITLHTDQENVASGFKARYFFETAKSEVGDCGGNFSNEESGIITSPHYPSNYKSPAKGLASMACNWYMTARPGYKLSINFEHFSVEGDPMARGCPAAVLRMWTNIDSEAAPIELCGEKPSTEHWHYISTGQSSRISFTTTDKTIGAQGFRIIWTEIQDSGPGPPAIGLLCESSFQFQCNIGYCISDKLRCNGIKNCGPGDDSDEMHCESYHGSSRRGSRRSNNNQHGRRLVPNLSPMHTLSSPKKTST
ncbi:uncharacterized protein LOC129943472 isoform X2 [Eupeodes corollae]|uniref:uncharacterized protein LOC129943472 isoform X2 n=2 Tax=Eupeodes corollae TaxID=290404 RepID=UPI0024935DEC|nr:uncharacterized protein LOC129943472 isoform X2 [Eupeodes corollae]